VGKKKLRGMGDKELTDLWAMTCYAVGFQVLKTLFDENLIGDVSPAAKLVLMRVAQAAKITRASLDEMLAPGKPGGAAVSFDELKEGVLAIAVTPGITEEIIDKHLAKKPRWEEEGGT